MVKKVCNACDIVKDISEFSGRSHICKKCKNIRQRDRYYQNKRSNRTKSKIPTIKKIIMKNLEDLNTLIQREDVLEDDLKKSKEQLDLAFEDYFEEVKVIEIPISISNETNEYWTICSDFKLKKAEISRFLKKSNNSSFEALFGPKRDRYYPQIADEVDDVLEVISAIGHMYSFIYTKMKSVHKSALEFDINYVPHLRSILIRHNELGISAESFIKKLKENMESDDFQISSFRLNETYDKLFKFMGNTEE